MDIYLVSQSGGIIFENTDVFPQIKTDLHFSKPGWTYAFRKPKWTFSHLRFHVNQVRGGLSDGCVPSVN